MLTMKKNDTHPPAWKYEEIKREAEKFLSKVHPEKTIPIPIEEIVEFELGIKVITIPNLKRDFNIDGFINSIFDTITVDDYVFDNYVPRARFTIAHELGHFVLHEEIYSKCDFEGLKGYIKFQRSIPSKDLYWLDVQANTFAGCFLVPSVRLKKEFDIARRKAGLPKKDLVEQGMPFLEDLPDKFGVSSDVLRIQIRKEKLLKNFL